MGEKYIRVSPSNRVAKVIPETDHCWSKAGLIFVRMAITDERRIFELPRTEFISEREYFKGCLGG